MGSSRAATTDDSATDSEDSSTSKTETDLDRDKDSDNTSKDNDEDEDDEESPPPSGAGAFSEGEKVLAFHKQFIYEARVRKAEYRSKEWKYFVHYLGWNKNWDEWVGVDRLMKYTEENIQKQQAINKKQGNEKNTRLGRASQSKLKGSNVGRGKKRKNEASTKEKGSLPMEKLVNIQIPPTLKKQLVDDCDFITHLGKLVKLPRIPNVDDICKKYLEQKAKNDVLTTDSVGEIMNGLRTYFDKALPAMLLYKSERQQHEEAVAEGISPSTVYGAEHLLRLFVKLPELLSNAKIDDETVMELQKNLNDFLKFLQKNQSTFFLSTYHVPDDIETSSNK